LLGNFCLIYPSKPERAQRGVTKKSLNTLLPQINLKLARSKTQCPGKQTAPKAMLAVPHTAAVYTEEIQFICLCNTGQRTTRIKHDTGTPVKIKALVFEEVDRRYTILQ